MKRTPGALQGWILTATPWLTVFGVVMLSPVLPFMEKDFAHLPNSKALVMAVLTAPALIIALTSPFVGALVQQFGRKKLLVASIIVYAIAGSAPFWLTDLYQIIFSRLIVGVTEAILQSVATVLTVDYFSGRARERWLAIAFGSGAFVAVVAFGLGGVLGGMQWGWHTPFLVYGAMIVMLPLYLLFLWEPANPVDEYAQKTEAAKTFPWVRIAPLWAMTLLVGIGFYVVPVQLPFILTARGIQTPEAIGFYTAIANIGVPTGSFIFQAMTRQPVLRTLALGFAFFAGGFTLAATSTTPQVALAGAFIACVGGGVALPLQVTWIMSRLDFEHRGLGSGGFVGTFYLGQFLSPVVMALIVGSIGGLDAAIIAFACAAGFGAVFTLFVGATSSGRAIKLDAPEVNPSGAT